MQPITGDFILFEMASISSIYETFSKDDYSISKSSLNSQLPSRKNWFFNKKNQKLNYNILQKLLGKIILLLNQLVKVLINKKINLISKL